MKKEKDVFDPLRKRRSKRQTIEREEYKIDVRYQNRTEITLDCEEKNTIKGYFVFAVIKFKNKEMYPEPDLTKTSDWISFYTKFFAVPAVLFPFFTNNLTVLCFFIEPTLIT